MRHALLTQGLCTSSSGSRNPLHCTSFYLPTFSAPTSFSLQSSRICSRRQAPPTPPPPPPTPTSARGAPRAGTYRASMPGLTGSHRPGGATHLDLRGCLGPRLQGYRSEARGERGLLGPLHLFKHGGAEAGEVAGRPRLPTRGECLREATPRSTRNRAENQRAKARSAREAGAAPKTIEYNR